ncbi:hypothetical protein Tco_0433040 [Tanacetum coccineum]
MGSPRITDHHHRINIPGPEAPHHHRISCLARRPHTFTLFTYQCTLGARVRRSLWPPEDQSDPDENQDEEILRRIVVRGQETSFLNHSTTSPLTPLSSPFPPPLPVPISSPPILLPYTDRRADRPEFCLPPQKRLLLTAPGPRYEIGESSSIAATRPTRGHRADYGFVDTMDAEIRRQRAKEFGYGIRDSWVDSREVAEDIAPMTLEGVNTRVTELTAVQEQDTDDIYAYHYETARLLDQEAQVSREAWAHSMGLGSAVHYELQGYMTHIVMQDHRIDAHESLVATLAAHVSLLQGHLAKALGKIRAL